MKDTTPELTPVSRYAPAQRMYPEIEQLQWFQRLHGSQAPS